MVEKSIDDIIQKYVEKICENYEVHAIILFGPFTAL